MRQWSSTGGNSPRSWTSTKCSSGSPSSPRDRWELRSPIRAPPPPPPAAAQAPRADLCRWRSADRDRRRSPRLEPDPSVRCSGSPFGEHGDDAQGDELQEGALSTPCLQRLSHCRGKASSAAPPPAPGCVDPIAGSSLRKRSVSASRDQSTSPISLWPVHACPSTGRGAGTEQNQLLLGLGARHQSSTGIVLD